MTAHPLEAKRLSLGSRILLPGLAGEIILRRGNNGNTYTSLSGLRSGVNFAVADITTGQFAATSGDAYTGPVAGIDRELVLITPDNLNISGITPNPFIHSG